MFRTTVLVCDDWTGLTCEIYPDGLRLLKPDTERLALKPQDRSGLKSTIYLQYARIEGMLPHFLKMKQDKRNFYALPDEFKGLEAIEKFKGITEVNSVLIDFGKLLRDNKPLFEPQTFSKQVSMNDTGPERFACYKVAQISRPTLSHQPSHELIISVSGHPTEKDKVQLSAFSDSYPHNLVKQLSIEKEHFKYSMLP